MNVIARGSENGYTNEILTTEHGFRATFIELDGEVCDTHLIQAVPETGNAIYAFVSLGGGAEYFNPAGFIQCSLCTFHAYYGREPVKTFLTLEEAVIYMVNRSNQCGYDMDIDYIKKV